jgi:hypothetical protein
VSKESVGCNDICKWRRGGANRTNKVRVFIMPIYEHLERTLRVYLVRLYINDLTYRQSASYTRVY